MRKLSLVDVGGTNESKVGEVKGERCRSITVSNLGPQIRLHGRANLCCQDCAALAMTFASRRIGAGCLFV